MPKQPQKPKPELLYPETEDEGESEDSEETEAEDTETEDEEPVQRQPMPRQPQQKQPVRQPAPQPPPAAPSPDDRFRRFHDEVLVKLPLVAVGKPVLVRGVNGTNLIVLYDKLVRPIQQLQVDDADLNEWVTILGK